MSYVTHCLAELGATNEIITATFYKQQYMEPKENEERPNFNLKEYFNYANMQSVLLAISCMYFMIGTTLEYTKNAEIIICIITFVFGCLKAGVSGSLKITI